MANMDIAFQEAKRAGLVLPGTRSPTSATIPINELDKIPMSIATGAYTLMYGLSSPTAQANIQETIKRSVIRRFVPYVNLRAHSNPKSLHHVYEWNHAGDTRYRLFDPVIAKVGRRKATFKVEMVFKPSKTLVPLTQAQETPGPSGQVVKKRYRFFQKATVMETGADVTIRRLGDSLLAFGETKILFSKGPIHINYSNKPTHGAFSRVTTEFFTRMAPQMTDQAMAAYALKASRQAELSTVLLGVNIPSDALARSRADRISRTIGPVIA